MLEVNHQGRYVTIAIEIDLDCKPRLTIDDLHSIYRDWYSECKISTWETKYVQAMKITPSELSVDRYREHDIAREKLDAELDYDKVAALIQIYFSKVHRFYNLDLYDTDPIQCCICRKNIERVNFGHHELPTCCPKDNPGCVNELRQLCRKHGIIVTGFWHTNCNCPHKA